MTAETNWSIQHKYSPPERSLDNNRYQKNGRKCPGLPCAVGVGVEASIINQQKSGFPSSFRVYLCMFRWYSRSAHSGYGYCILNTKLNGVCCLFSYTVVCNCHFGESWFLDTKSTVRVFPQDQHVISDV